MKLLSLEMQLIQRGTIAFNFLLIFAAQTGEHLRIGEMHVRHSIELLDGGMGCLQLAVRQLAHGALLVPTHNAQPPQQRRHRQPMDKDRKYDDPEGHRDQQFPMRKILGETEYQHHGQPAA